LKRPWAEVGVDRDIFGVGLVNVGSKLGKVFKTLEVIMMLEMLKVQRGVDDVRSLDHMEVAVIRLAKGKKEPATG